MNFNTTGQANAPKDKAKVERGVQLAQRWIFAKIRITPPPTP
jgi:hypothetical protein